VAIAVDVNERRAISGAARGDPRPALEAAIAAAGVDDRLFAARIDRGDVEHAVAIDIGDRCVIGHAARVDDRIRNQATIAVVAIDVELSLELLAVVGLVDHERVEAAIAIEVAGVEPRHGVRHGHAHRRRETREQRVGGRQWVVLGDLRGRRRRHFRPRRRGEISAGTTRREERQPPEDAHASSIPRRRRRASGSYLVRRAR
jgi:hypothetical protein